MPLHFGEFFGDPVPFFSNGVYHIFYLSPRQPDHEWRHIASSDLLHWETYPTAIAPGTADDAPDRDGCWTGSIIERDGVFHMFYTGYRQDRPDTQVICHASSTDLIHWTKDAANPVLRSDGVVYDLSDWRDPHVIRHGDGYQMLITARLRDGLELRRGAVALATSSDLADWTLQPPLWSNGLSYSPECVDLFEWRQRYVMLYSAHVEDNQTHFRVSASPDGPWAAPRFDTIDGEHFYAAKSAGNAERRLIFGWVPRRRDESDAGAWYWGGSFALPRELVELPDGSIGVRCPPEIVNAPRIEIPFTLSPRHGQWDIDRAAASASATYGFCFATVDDLPDAYVLTASIRMESGTRDAGFIVHTTPDLQQGYQVHFQPRQIAYEPLPRTFWTPPSPARPHAMDFSQRREVQIFVEGSLIEVFVDNQIALVSRSYNRRGRSLGFYAQDGTVAWRDIRLQQL